MKPRAVANPVKMSAEAGVKSTSRFPSVLGVSLVPTFSVLVKIRDCLLKFFTDVA